MAPKNKGAAGNSPAKVSNGTSEDASFEESRSGGGGCIRSFFLLTTGFLLGVGACVGAMGVVVYPSTAPQAVEFLAQAGVPIAQLRALQTDLCPERLDAAASAAKCPAVATPKCPECAKCPACPACSPDTASQANAAECNKKLGQHQKEHKDATEKLSKAEAAWAAERKDLEQSCERSVAAAVEKAVAAQAAPATATETRSAPTPWTPTQAVLAVMGSDALKACDAGTQGNECPDLHAAMRTWDFAIKQLKTALQGSNAETAGMGPYLEQISTDAEAFLNMPVSSPQLKDVYATGAYNNRQVFEVVRPFITQTPQTPADHLDASLPRPVRGLLCAHDNCDA